MNDEIDTEVDVEIYNEDECDTEYDIQKDTIFDNSNSEDFMNFTKNYNKLKNKNQTNPYLTKYERTRILSERTQQIVDGSTPLIPNVERFTSAYEIAVEELNTKKLPFIIRRPLPNLSGFEYWKLDDLLH